MSLPSAMGWHQMAPSQPAYHTVPVRTAFVRPSHTVRWPVPPTAASSLAAHPPPQEMAATPEKPKKIAWPEPVKAYVRRAFEPENEVPGVSFEDMQVKLKEVISYFAERGMHDQIDWTVHPLPQQLIALERRRAASAVQSLTASLDHMNYTAGPTNNHNPSTFSSPPAAKRKSHDMEDAQQNAAKASIPPWQKNSLEDRITFGSGQKETKRQKKNGIINGSSSKFDQADLEKRKQRFQLADAGTDRKSVV